MFRRVRIIENDILRISGYIRVYPANHFFRSDMLEMLGKLKKELEVSMSFFESLEED